MKYDQVSTEARRDALDQMEDRIRASTELGRMGKLARKDRRFNSDSLVSWSMTDVDYHSVYEDDDTLRKLQTALANADGHKVKHSIEGAVEDRKKELRQNVYAHGEK